MIPINYVPPLPPFLLWLTCWPSIFTEIDHHHSVILLSVTWSSYLVCCFILVLLLTFTSPKKAFRNVGVLSEDMKTLFTLDQALWKVFLKGTSCFHILLGKSASMPQVAQYVFPGSSCYTPGKERPFSSASLIQKAKIRSPLHSWFIPMQKKKKSKKKALKGY